MTPTDKIRLAGCILVVLSLAGLWLMRPRVVRNERLPKPRADSRSSIEQHRRIMDVDMGDGL